MNLKLHLRWILSSLLTTACASKGTAPHSALETPSTTKSPNTIQTGSYFLSTDSTLEIESASASGLKFELSGVNSYRASTCGVEGVAKSDATPTWIYLDQDEPACKITLTPTDGKGFEVTVTDECNRLCGMGASLDGGLYRLASPECSADKHTQVQKLFKKKAYRESIEAGLAYIRNCGDTLDDNPLGSLYSDLSLAAYRLKSKTECLNFVDQGLRSMHLASEGSKALTEAQDFYKDTEQPGYDIYKERVKIYGWLKHNQKLCSSLPNR